MKSLFKIKYPKLIILLLMIVFSYFIFSDEFIQQKISGLGNWGYLGIFLAGMFFTFGFSSPFSAGFFIILNPENIWLAGIVGGFGALFSDLTIFKLIKFGFQDEFNQLRKSKAGKKAIELIRKNVGQKLKVYLIYALVGFTIASPLPDEVGITMLAGLNNISWEKLAIVSFILNSLGIIFLMLI